MHRADEDGSQARALVLLTETYADGGIQRFNRTFLSACDRLSVACDVLSLGDNERSRQRWTETKLADIRVFARNKIRFVIAALAALVRGDYDFVIIGHVNLLVLATACARLRRARRARVMLIAHGIEVWTGLSRSSRRRAFELVDLILSVSRYTRDRMQAQVPELGIERFAIFPNALSESWMEPIFYEGCAAADRLLPENFLLCVTRLDRGDRYKGIVTAFEALAMLPDRSVHYVIAGQGDDQEFLRRAAARLGVNERVHFLGSVSDAELSRLYQKCKAFVLPSGKEGFGIVFLEAMYFGAPVIAAREKGAVDVVKDGETGLTVRYGDSIALAAAIDRILSDPGLRTRLRDAARALVLDFGMFTFNAYVARLAQVLGVQPVESNPMQRTRGLETYARSL